SYEKPGLSAKDALPILRPLLADADPKARARAVGLIGRLGPAAREAAPDLVRAFKDKELRKVVSADSLIGDSPVEALARIGADAVPALIVALPDKDFHVRFQATQALARLGRRAQKAIPALEKALKDETIGVALEAAVALLHAGAKAEQPLAVFLS